jgi:hypothetical protein
LHWYLLTGGGSKKPKIMNRIFTKFSLFATLCLLTATAFSQKTFVSFETTSGLSKTCQGKTLGVIATIEPRYEDQLVGNWVFDNDNFREVKENIAIANSSTTGEKELKYTATDKNGNTLDTVFRVTIIPNPELKVSYDGTKVSMVMRNQDLVSYKWIINGSLVDHNESNYSKPAR